MTQLSSGTHPGSMLSTRVRGLPQSIEIDYRLDKKFSQGFPGVPAAAEGSKNKQQKPVLAHSPRRDTPVPYMRWGWGCVQWSGRRGGLGGLPAPQAMLCAGGVCRGHVQYPALLPTPCFCSRLLKSGRWVFSLFVSFRSKICPYWARMQLFLVLYSFFVFCCSRRGVSGCKLCSITAKGPRSQAFLKYRGWIKPKVIRFKGTGEHSQCPWLLLRLKGFILINSED